MAQANVEKHDFPPSDRCSDVRRLSTISMLGRERSGNLAGAEYYRSYVSGLAATECEIACRRGRAEPKHKLQHSCLRMVFGLAQIVLTGAKWREIRVMASKTSRGSWTLWIDDGPDTLPASRSSRSSANLCLAEYDLAPKFPVLLNFLEFWGRELAGPVHSVMVAHSRLIKPAEFRTVDGVLTLH
jgi:hypothetical protein